MKLNLLALSCVLLGALPVPGATRTSTAAVQVTPDSEATIVIRYDPEAVFLTHELVAPLSLREVKIEEGGITGRLLMVRMNSNELQPKGVFVGGVRMDWRGDEPPADRRDALLDGGLEQLRQALASRLVRPRRNQIERRIAVLEQMEQELQYRADLTARELARREELGFAEREFEEATSALRASEYERAAAQKELMVAMTKIEEEEAKLEAARAKHASVRTDLERVRQLAEKAMISERELAKGEVDFQVASRNLQVASAQVEFGRLQIEQRRSELSEVEDTIAVLKERIAGLKGRLLALAEEEMSGSVASLRLSQTTDRGRLTELGSELQRARAELETLAEVTLERW